MLNSEHIISASYQTKKFSYEKKTIVKTVANLTTVVATKIKIVTKSIVARFSINICISAYEVDLMHVVLIGRFPYG